MRITATLEIPKFDRRAYERALAARLTDAIQSAARVWLHATVGSLIPVWSGASVATFLHLARAAQYGLHIKPTARIDRTGLGEYRSGPSQPFVLGQGGLYTFEYSTTLRHLVFNEFNDANLGRDPAVFAKLKSPGPYNFQIAGQVAFRQFARSVRLPNPMSYIKTTIVKV